MISYATQPGNTAADGTGADSPYTEALAEAMTQPGLDALRMFNRVGLTVKRVTGGQQQPWLSSSPIDGDYYFAGPGSSPAPSGPVPTPPAGTLSAAPSVTALVQPVRPEPAREDPTGNLIGHWRFGDGADCSAAHSGIVSVKGGYIYFEWRRASGLPNLAVERIERVEGNVIFTVVESDKNTRTPETGHKIRYVVSHDSWTSENLVTGKSYTHRRC